MAVADQTLDAERTSGWKLLTHIFDVGLQGSTPQDLVSDYIEEMSLAASLKAHAAGMPYPFLRETMDELAEETDEHRQALGDLLRRHHIALPDPPDSPQVTSHAWMVRNLDDDIRAVKQRIFRYDDLLKNVPRDIARVIEPIHEDKQRHERTLIEVAVRVVR